MVDALDSKSGISNGVRVQVPSPVTRKGSIERLDLFALVWTSGLETRRNAVALRFDEGGRRRAQVPSLENKDQGQLLGSC